MVLVPSFAMDGTGSPRSFGIGLFVLASAAGALGCGSETASPGECTVNPVEAGRVELDARCTWTPSGPVDDPWNVVLEWHHEMLDVDEGGYVQQAPMVAAPAPGDLASIAFPTFHGNAVEEESDLIVLDGNGSARLHVDYATGWNAPLLADVDGDGGLDIVTSSFFDYLGGVPWVHAFGHDGSALWESELFDDNEFLSSAKLTAADLEGDGSVEVLFHNVVLSGEDGSTLYTLDYVQSMSTVTETLAADLDADGRTEILAGGKVFSHNGETLWEAVDFPESPWPVFHAVADLDGDSLAEVVLASGQLLATFEHDGTLLHRVSFDGRGPPCIADLDGDGHPEIAASATETIEAFDAQLNRLWSHPTPSDFGCGAARGCSAFDFDGDGAAEVVYAGLQDLFILDGATGSPLFTDDEFIAAGGHVTSPVIADVDADGSAEIVLSAMPVFATLDYGDTSGILVYGHAENAWPPAGPYWGLSDYAPLRVHPDGHVASPTPPWWRYHNMYHARPPGDGLPDLVPVPGDVCAATCDPGSVRLSWGIANQGLGEVYHPVRVTLYCVEGGAHTPLDVFDIADVVRYGSVLPGSIIGLEPGDCAGSLELVVDDDGSGHSGIDECDEANNTWEIPLFLCP